MGFSDALQNTLQFEGGYSNSPNDAGGPTINGISSKWFPEDFKTQVSLINSGNTDAANAHLQDFYKKNFWDPIDGDSLSPAMQNVAFDTAVNNGVPTAKKLMVQAGDDPDALLALRAQRDQTIAASDPNQMLNASGWQNRINNLSAQTSQMNPQPDPTVDAFAASLSEASQPSAQSQNPDPTVEAFAASLMDAQSQPQQTQGLMSNIASDLSKRSSNISQIMSTPPQAGVPLLPAAAGAGINVAGNVAGGLWDVGGDLAKSFYQNTSTPDTKKAFSSAFNYLINTPVGQAGVQALQYGGQKWDSFKQTAPMAAQLIENASNIAAFYAPLPGGGTPASIVEAVPGVATDVAKGTLGAAGDLVVGAATPIAQRVAEGLVPLDEEGLRLAGVAKDLDIPLDLAQLSQNPALLGAQKFSAPQPFSGAGEFEAEQKGAVTSAVMKSLGSDSEVATPSAVKELKDSFKDKYGKIYSGTLNVAPDKVSALDNIIPSRVGGLTADDAKIVQQNIDMVKKEIGSPSGSALDLTKPTGMPGILQPQVENAFISGERLGSLRTKILSNMKTASPAASMGIGDVLDTVDDIAGQDDPLRSAALSSVNAQYRNFKTVEPILAKANRGVINPNLLEGMVYKNFGTRYATGQAGDLGDIAKIAKTFLNNPMGSATAVRNFGMGEVGAMSAGLAFNPPLAAVAIPTAVTANRGFQTLLHSPKVTDSYIKSSLQALVDAKKATP